MAYRNTRKLKVRDTTEMLERGKTRALLLRPIGNAAAFVASPFSAIQAECKGGDVLPALARRSKKGVLRAHESIMTYKIASYRHEEALVSTMLRRNKKPLIVPSEPISRKKAGEDLVGILEARPVITAVLLNLCIGHG